jgi:hypothetical protein
MAGLETLDEATPRDTDAVSLGDDAIRETRQKTKTSVGVEHYLDGRHKVPGGTTAERPAAGAVGRVYFNVDTKTMEYDDGTIWSSLADAKARATILWHPGDLVVPNGSTYEIPFDTIIDDPGGFGYVQYHQIIQPANSMGMVSAYVETAGTPGGFGMSLAIQQYDLSAPPQWRVLAQQLSTGPAFINLTTMVDSRWGVALRVVLVNATGGNITIKSLPMGSSPRFGYHMVGRTS